jgi:rSAM/selenodomain-associated transferase 1
MADAMRQTLIIMVKAPVLGRAKTRLARQIGGVEALRFYRAATAGLLRRVSCDPRWETVLAVDPPRACQSTFWPIRIERRPQSRGDLGARMLDQFGKAPHGPAVLIGSDIPGVAARHIAAAFAALRRHDAVFGPAEDGGYWLVGLRAGHRPGKAFAGVRWSSEHALADSRASLGGSRVALVETLFDVDDAADWRRWRALPIPVSAR